MNCLYLIKDNKTGLVKIGITSQWTKRAQTLHVDRKTTAILVVKVENNREHERLLHEQYAHQRLPATEWFSLTDFQIENLTRKVKKLGEAIIDNSPKPFYHTNAAWSDPASRKKVKKFWDNFEWDELWELQEFNPWFKEAEWPRDKYEMLEYPRLDLYYYEPKSCGGKLVNCWICPDGSYDGEFDCEDEDANWIAKTFGGKPKGFEETLERIWILNSLPEHEKPLPVILRQIYLDEEKRQFDLQHETSI